MQSKGNYFFIKKVELKQNFTQIPNQIFKLKQFKHIEKLILIYLFSNSENFRITQYRIQKDLNTDVRTVKKALDKFKDLEILKLIENRKYMINIGVIQHACSSTPIEKDTCNSTPTIDVVQHLDTCNSTPNISVELHNNNKNQQEIKKEKQKEKNFKNFEFDFLSEVENLKPKIEPKFYFKIYNPKYFTRYNFDLDVSKKYIQYRNEYNNKIDYHQFEKLIYGIVCYHLIPLDQSKRVKHTFTLGKLYQNNILPQIDNKEINKTIQLINEDVDYQIMMDDYFEMNDPNRKLIIKE